MCFMTNTVLMHIRTTCVLMPSGLIGAGSMEISVTALAEKCGCGKVAQSKTCILYRLHAALARMIISAHLNASAHSWVSLLQKATVWV